MKNYILKGLCYFFIIISLLLIAVPVAASAQSGHGGSTEVIARVEPETTASSTETQPSTTQPEPKPSDSQPIQTGQMFAWIAFVILFASGAVLIVFGIRENEKNQQ